MPFWICFYCKAHNDNDTYICKKCKKDNINRETGKRK